VGSSSTERLIDIVMPAMGTSVSEGTVTTWCKEIGDPIERDENVCEISSDKVDVECPAPAAGVLREILVEVGDTVDVGTALGRIGVADEDAASNEPAEADEAAPASRSEESGAETAAESGSEGATGSNDAPTDEDGNEPHVTPVVRRMADHHNLDLSKIEGTGRNERVTKKDVEAHLRASSDEPGEAQPPLDGESRDRPDPDQAPPPEPVAVAASAPSAAGEPQQLSRMRQSIGRAMLDSLATAATCTTIVECDMSAVEHARSRLGVTALPVVASKVIETLREFGSLNATLDGEMMTVFDDVHLGIAVSLGEEGLVVPVIRDAQDLSIEGLSKTIKKLARAARDKQLGPDDYAGATFTVTSPGAFGALIATPVINLPQVGILDIETITRRPVVVAEANGNESIGIRSMAYFCLSWDHRAIDGAYAAQFLTALRARVESI